MAQLIQVQLALRHSDLAQLRALVGDAHLAPDEVVNRALTAFRFELAPERERVTQMVRQAALTQMRQRLP